MLKKMDKEYSLFVDDVAKLVEASRRLAVKNLNNIMTATYWLIGRRIIEQEQEGKDRAQYGKGLLESLSQDLSSRFGKGYSPDNLETMRIFYRTFSPDKISETPSRKLRIESKKAKGNKSETLSRKFDLRMLAESFPLAWSHYVSLLRRSRSKQAMDFYHAEALRGGWTIRQLNRQIDSQFYERTVLSRNKNKMLRAGRIKNVVDELAADEEIKDPLVLEFLGLKDEYSESQLEEAIIHKLENFLLEMGNDFAFIGRQRRLRIDDEWFRVDLLLFHRRLRCLVIIDLKLGRFTHADAGQMNLYLNYAREHWMQSGENPPVGVILCSSKGDSLVRYSTEGLPNKTLVREYLHVLPNEKLLTQEINKTRESLEGKVKLVKRRKS